MIKCNTDGACRGNSGNSSYGFCYRDWFGEVIYAESGLLGVTTNIIVEATTIREAVSFEILQGYLNILIETTHSI